LNSQQLVAEALTLMSKNGLNCLPVYDNDHVIGKLTYDELAAFLADDGNTGGMHAHKLHFDIGSALIAIRKMKAERYKTPLRYHISKRLIAELSVAAIIVMTLMGLTWLFFKSTIYTDLNNPVIPGLNRVVLTLENGENIALNDAKAGVIATGNTLKYNDGTRVQVSPGLQPRPDHEILTLNTSNGGVYRLILPDGSKVWLNAASSLKFPATFAGDAQRRVELNGEAYFEIAKANRLSPKGPQRIPFIVVSKGQQIEVLGTHFNVYAYRNEALIKTTLMEGSVRVTPLLTGNGRLKSPDPVSLDPMETKEASLKRSQGVVLKPNQQAILTGTTITVKAVNAEEAIAWRGGEFIFRNTPLESIMLVVARWYDVDVIYQDAHTSKELLGGTLSRSSKMPDVLKTLELTANVRFKVDGKKITVIQL
jgi:transmembrane sensor